MKIILITGLDGSGKSTIFSALDLQKQNKIIDTLRLPFIDTESISSNSLLQKAALFSNYINLKGDKENLPQLKAIALFASMLLYKKLVESKTDTDVQKIFCERHPLIDAPVYAGFYTDKINSGTIKKISFEVINSQFKQELNYIVNLIPDKLLSEKQPKVEFLINFIYQWFYIGKKVNFDQLSSLFEVELPDEIYFLKASPKILMERLAGRKIFEAHENESALTDLSMAYEVLLKELKNKYPGLLNIIDANSFESLNVFRKLIETSCEK